VLWMYFLPDVIFKVPLRWSPNGRGDDFAQFFVQLGWRPLLSVLSAASLFLFAVTKDRGSPVRGRRLRDQSEAGAFIIDSSTAEPAEEIARERVFQDGGRCVDVDSVEHEVTQGTIEQMAVEACVDPPSEEAGSVPGTRSRSQSSELATALEKFPFEGGATVEVVPCLSRSQDVDTTGVEAQPFVEAKLAEDVDFLAAQTDLEDVIRFSDGAGMLRMWRKGPDLHLAPVSESEDEVEWESENTDAKSRKRTKVEKKRQMDSTLSSGVIEGESTPGDHKSGVSSQDAQMELAQHPLEEVAQESKCETEAPARDLKGEVSDELRGLQDNRQWQGEQNDDSDMIAVVVKDACSGVASTTDSESQTVLEENTVDFLVEHMPHENVIGQPGLRTHVSDLEMHIQTLEDICLEEVSIRETLPFSRSASAPVRRSAAALSAPRVVSDDVQVPKLGSIFPWPSGHDGQQHASGQSTPLGSFRATTGSTSDCSVEFFSMSTPPVSAPHSAPHTPRLHIRDRMDTQSAHRATLSAPGSASANLGRLRRADTMPTNTQQRSVQSSSAPGSACVTPQRLSRSQTMPESSESRVEVSSPCVSAPGSVRVPLRRLSHSQTTPEDSHGSQVSSPCISAHGSFHPPLRRLSHSQTMPEDPRGSRVEPPSPGISAPGSVRVPLGRLSHPQTMSEDPHGSKVEPPSPGISAPGSVRVPLKTLSRSHSDTMPYESKQCQPGGPPLAPPWAPPSATPMAPQHMERMHAAPLSPQQTVHLRHAVATGVPSPQQNVVPRAQPGVASVRPGSATPAHIMSTNRHNWSAPGARLPAEAGGYKAANQILTGAGPHPGFASGAVQRVNLGGVRVAGQTLVVQGPSHLR